MTTQLALFSSQTGVGETTISPPRVPRFWRWDVIERDKGRCRRCGAVGQEVHHIRARRYGNGLDNVIVLCRPCHLYVHAHQKTERPRLVAMLEGYHGSV